MTSENLGGALVILVAVLLGAALPALLQLRATLKALEQSGARIDGVLVATAALATRLDGLVAKVEKDGRIDRLLDSLADVSDMAIQLKQTVQIASAVGAAVAPAIAAAVEAFRGGDPEGAAAGPAPEHEPTPHAEGANA